MRDPCHHYKLLINRSPSYLYSIIPQPTSNIQTRSAPKNPPLTRTVAFQNSIFKIPDVTCACKLDINIRDSTSFLSFKDAIFKEIKPQSNLIFGIHNTLGLKFLTRLRMSFSHLREHKFKHNFQNTLETFCNCPLDIETTAHFFLHCHNCMNQRQTLLAILYLLEIWFGNPKYSVSINSETLITSISDILSAKRFDEDLV